MRNILLIVPLFVITISCSKADKSNDKSLLKMKEENITNNFGIKTKPFARTNSPGDSNGIKPPVLPMKGDKMPVKVPAQFKNLKLEFPKTLCGDITKKIMSCEISRITLKYSGKEAFIKSKTTYIRMKFAKKMNKYVDHCKTVVKPLKETEIRRCLAMDCKKMDQCMKSLTGLKKNTGQK